jgi:hypothetical protein
MSDTNIKVMIPVTQGSRLHSHHPPTVNFDVVVEMEGDDIVLTRLHDINPYIKFSKRDLHDALKALGANSVVYRDAAPTTKLPTKPGVYSG